jgi:polyisoprenoid-binding protein YceI
LRKPSLAAVVVSLLCCSLGAQQLAVDLDSTKTKINWILVGNVHTVHGSFLLKEGHLTLDPRNGAVSGDLVADATSGESGNGARDKRMNKEILESDRFQEIRLTPKTIDGSVSLSGRSTVRVNGTFLIHGTTHEVSIPMNVSLSGDAVTGTGKFSIPYVDWGMKDPSNFLFKVDKSVEVEIVAVGKLTAK